jgi:hypothetical protein
MCPKRSLESSDHATFLTEEIVHVPSRIEGSLSFGQYMMAAIAEPVDQPASAQTGSVVLHGLSVYLGPEGRQTLDDKMTQLRTLGETPVVVVLADRSGELTTIMIWVLPLMASATLH